MARSWGDAPRLRGWPAGGGAAQPSEELADDALLPHPDVEQHGADQDHADPDIDPMLRHHEGALCGDDLKRHQPTQEGDHRGPRQRPKHRAIAAEDAAAANDY